MYETADLQVALGNKRVQTRSGLDHRERDGIRARFVARECKGDETMCDVLAPSSTPSTGRISDYLRLKKACHTFAADVTNAYFRVGEDAECFVDPPTEWLDQQGALGNPTSVLWRKQLYGQRRAGTRWVDLMAQRLEEQSFDRCDASPQCFANYELDVFVEVHMDDLHGTGPIPALDLV